MSPLVYGSVEISLRTRRREVSPRSDTWDALDQEESHEIIERLCGCLGSVDDAVGLFVGRGGPGERSERGECGERGERGECGEQLARRAEFFSHCALTDAAKLITRTDFHGYHYFVDKQ
jgi:hypothetical protein